MLQRDKVKGLTFSLVLHLVIFVIIGALGLVHWHKQKNNKIYTVTLMSGGAGGGNSSAQGKSTTLTKAKAQMRVRADDITEKAPVEQKYTNNEQVTNTSESLKNTSSETTDKASANTTGGTEKETGTGSGNGMGTGSGNGMGEGAGTGSGAGTGPGFDVNAIQADVAPAFLGGEAPNYPETLRSRGVQGTVVVEMIVGKSGSVESAYVTSSSGSGALDRAAVNAAYTYSFAPAFKEGYPVRCYATRTVRFYLN